MKKKSLYVFVSIPIFVVLIVVCACKNEVALDTSSVKVNDEQTRAGMFGQEMDSRFQSDANKTNRTIKASLVEKFGTLPDFFGGSYITELC